MIKYPFIPKLQLGNPFEGIAWSYFKLSSLSEGWFRLR